MSLTGIVILISTASARALSNGNKTVDEIVMQKLKKFKKNYDRDMETIKSFDNLYRKILQDNIVDNNEYESLCKKFTKCLVEVKNESFL